MAVPVTGYGSTSYWIWQYQIWVGINLLFLSLLPDRQKVLQHHPDKQQASGGGGEEIGDDLFKCIKIGREGLWGRRTESGLCP